MSFVLVQALAAFWWLAAGVRLASGDLTCAAEAGIIAAYATADALREYRRRLLGQA